MTGHFAGTATFGAGESNETVVRAPAFGVASSDVFVAKYGTDGTLLWVTTAGGAGFDNGSGIATDPSGNVYVSGQFDGPATFGVGEANETVLEGGSVDGFVAKYARDGTFLWATSASAASSDGIAVDPRGNSYVTGSFSGTATFGAGGANEKILEAVAAYDVFVAKYDRDGTLVWVTSAGGGSNDVGLAIAIDPRGNSNVTGSFSGAATFGAGEANETVLEGVVSEEVFVAKYASSGALLWATSATSSGGFLAGRGIATDPRGNAYVTGFFIGTATFGAGEANETVLEAVAARDVFVAKYRP